MNGKIKHGKRGMWISLCCGFLILGLAACNLPGTGADDPEPTVTGGESQEVELGQPEQVLKKVECPNFKEMYALSYDHYIELNIGKADGLGEEIHLRQEEAADASFYFWIEPSGKVSQEGLMDYTRIYVDGWHTTHSKECPVNYIQGTWILIAEITGKCEDGFVELEVKHRFENNELKGSCDEPMEIPGGYSSGPETLVTFNLSEPGYTKGNIERGEEGGFLYVRHRYMWYTAEDGYIIPPLTSP